MPTRKTLLLIGALAVILLAGPALMRVFLLGYNQRSYTAPVVDSSSLAATPESTATPFAAPQSSVSNSDEISPGPVVIDYAHFNQINPAALQSLASELARRGVTTRSWVSSVDPFSLKSFSDFPDQSQELATQLSDASGLIVISPFFLWSPSEITVVERFVADGGRLLLISDPDVFGDAAVVSNLLAERFGVVFNDDYLYDTVRNDQNYTHFFQGEFRDQATALDGAVIAFYGGRSIAGDVESQVRSANTTLSSLGTGVTGFTTVAIGGMEGRGTAGRVLAMSDLDVFSAPNAVRHDNHRIVEFVADFLARGERVNTVADFPAYMGSRVALAYGIDGALDAELLLLGAQLQRKLEANGRSLRLTSQTAFTTIIPITGTEIISETAVLDASPGEDVLYLGVYEVAATQTDLLAAAGVRLVTEIITPTAAAHFAESHSGEDHSATLEKNQESTGDDTDSERPIGTPTPTPTVINDGERPQGDAEPGSEMNQATTIAVTSPTTGTARAPVSTPTVTILPKETQTPTPTPTATPTPVEIVYLVTDGGLRVLASESALVIRHPLDAAQQMLGVLGADSAGVSAAVKRLLTNDLADCITDATVTVCPVDGSSAPPTQERSSSAKTTDDGLSTPTDEQRGTPSPEGPVRVLVVDDNRNAQPDETSEADFYLQALTATGIFPDLWSTKEKGSPSATEMSAYRWVIWSSAGYAENELDLAYVDQIFQFLNGGGRMTISSRKPFFGMGIDPPSVMRDVVTDDDVPSMVAGLPEAPIPLSADLPPIVPLAQARDEDNFQIALRRGPDSDNADAPVLITATDEGESDMVGARLAVVGMSVGWLPTEVQTRLIANMAGWMLEE